LYANQSFLELIRHDSAAGFGFRIQDCLTPGGSIFYETQFAPSLLIRGHLEEISFDFLTPEGNRVPTLVNAVLRPELQGDRSQIFLSVFGANQRRRYEAELLRARRESEEVSEVVRRSSDAILRISANDLIESWNRGAEQIFGYSAQSAIGKPIFLLISTDCIDSFKTVLAKMKLGEEALTETIACCDTGVTVNVSVNLTPHLEAPGTLVGYSAIIRNVNERKLAEKALLQSEKLASVGRLASSIAHEINNPLEAVTNLLYILQSRDTDDETKSLIHTAQDELARVSQIATQTLRFHKQSSSRTDVDIRGLFESVIGLYRARLQDSGITAVNDAAPQSSFICFDGEIRQILVNLVANSFDAMRSGGTLILRSRNTVDPETNDHHIRITVSDTGSGMEPSVLARLFEPFFSTKGIGGAGLGLWITKDLVQKNQGSIRVRSRTHCSQSGTVVFMQFPRVPHP
jgi:PAS domain S-box-containing protein